jgi:hypothetical protein
MIMFLAKLQTMKKETIKARSKYGALDLFKDVLCVEYLTKIVYALFAISYVKFN